MLGSTSVKSTGAIPNSAITAGSFASRLTTRVRHKEGLSYGSGSHAGADAKDKAGAFLMFAICNPANIEKVDKAMIEELDKLCKDGVSPTELAEAKKALLEQMKVERSSVSMLTMRLSQNLHAGRTFAYYADLEQKIAALTPEGVNSAARNHLDRKRLIIVQGGDFKKKAGGK